MPTLTRQTRYKLTAKFSSEHNEDWIKAQLMNVLTGRDLGGEVEFIEIRQVQEEGPPGNAGKVTPGET